MVVRVFQEHKDSVEDSRGRYREQRGTRSTAVDQNFVLVPSIVSSVLINEQPCESARRTKLISSLSLGPLAAFASPTIVASLSPVFLRTFYPSTSHSQCPRLFRSLYFQPRACVCVFYSLVLLSRTRCSRCRRKGSVCIIYDVYIVHSAQQTVSQPYRHCILYRLSHSWYLLNTSFAWNLQPRMVHSLPCFLLRWHRNRIFTPFLPHVHMYTSFVDVFYYVPLVFPLYTKNRFNKIHRNFIVSPQDAANQIFQWLNLKSYLLLCIAEFSSHVENGDLRDVRGGSLSIPDDSNDYSECEKLHDRSTNWYYRN